MKLMSWGGRFTCCQVGITCMQSITRKSIKSLLKHRYRLIILAHKRTKSSLGILARVHFLEWFMCYKKSKFLLQLQYLKFVHQFNSYFFRFFITTCPIWDVQQKYSAICSKYGNFAFSVIDYLNKWHMIYKLTWSDYKICHTAYSVYVLAVFLAISRWFRLHWKHICTLKTPCFDEWL